MASLSRLQSVLTRQQARPSETGCRVAGSQYMAWQGGETGVSAGAPEDLGVGRTYWSSLRKTPHTTLTATQRVARSSMRACGRLWK